MTPSPNQFSRQKLLEAAMRVFAEAGFRGATTRRIAEAAGVNEVTLFRQFKSKTALINEVAELYARRRSEESLPAGPVSPLKELADWCNAHLALLRNSRDMIRKCMAEVDDMPQMVPCMRRGPDVVHRQLSEYTEQLVRQRGLKVTPEDIHLACVMLQGALFAEAMGRDIMPDRYPPIRRAGEGYARMFLRMLGDEEEAGRPEDAGDRSDTTTRSGRRTGARQRTGRGRHQPPRGT
jgi:AcrR family transcriptional regulator